MGAADKRGLQKGRQARRAGRQAPKKGGLRQLTDCMTNRTLVLSLGADWLKRLRWPCGKRMARQRSQLGRLPRLSAAAKAWLQALLHSGEAGRSRAPTHVRFRLPPSSLQESGLNLQHLPAGTGTGDGTQQYHRRHSWLQKMRQQRRIRAKALLLQQRAGVSASRAAPPQPRCKSAPSLAAAGSSSSQTSNTHTHALISLHSTHCSPTNPPELHNHFLKTRSLPWVLGPAPLHERHVFVEAHKVLVVWPRQLLLGWHLQPQAVHEFAHQAPGADVWPRHLERHCDRQWCARPEKRRRAGREGGRPGQAGTVSSR